jgi:electron transfer flavoprotein beta subunit
MEGGEETWKRRCPCSKLPERHGRSPHSQHARHYGGPYQALESCRTYCVESLTEVKEFGMPPAKAGVKLVAPDNVDELVRLLHEEARVI